MASTRNAFGDQQLALDLAADTILMDALRACGVVHTASSEETPVEVLMNEGGRLSVAFDPLDGSSIVACNWAVGTIVGIWEAKGLVGVCGRDMVGAVVTVYGPSTTMFVAIGERWGESGRRVLEFTLREDGWSVSLVPDDVKEGKLFAPANLRATQDHDGYQRLVAWYMRERYTLRYTGGMVPDVTQILVKGYGVFTSPASDKAPAKLRLLYEVLPMGYVMEACGASSSDGHGSVLRLAVNKCDERSTICVGSRDEVVRFEAHCNSK